MEFQQSGFIRIYNKRKEMYCTIHI